MAPSPLHPRASRHARSISLPSRSHPLTLQVEEQLHRLKASEATSSSICHNFSGLKDLYDSVNDLLHLPLTQQTLAQERGEKWVDEVLDGSLRSLDVCGTAKDALSQMKECMTELQSSIRRTRRESGLANEIGAYILSRKKVTKMINKCLGDFRKVKKQHTFSSLLNKNHDIVALVSVLREVEAITLSILKSQLLIVSGPTAVSMLNGWSSLVSKLMNKKHKGLELRHAEAQKQLETLELSIQDIENGLECIFRSLIQTRVTLLNIFNQ